MNKSFPPQLASCHDVCAGRETLTETSVSSGNLGRVVWDWLDRGPTRRSLVRVGKWLPPPLLLGRTRSMDSGKGERAQDREGEIVSDSLSAGAALPLYLMLHSTLCGMNQREIQAEDAWELQERTSLPKW